MKSAIKTPARRPASRNLHVPLSPDLHRRLRDEARRSGTPATALARAAIQAMLNARQREALRIAITTYATATAGTGADLDDALEAAALDVLLAEKDRW